MNEQTESEKMRDSPLKAMVYPLSKNPEVLRRNLHRTNPKSGVSAISPLAPLRRNYEIDT
jgi:hypothetical protein